MSVRPPQFGATPQLRYNNPTPNQNNRNNNNSPSFKGLIGDLELAGRYTKPYGDTVTIWAKREFNGIKTLDHMYGPSTPSIVSDKLSGDIIAYGKAAKNIPNLRDKCVDSMSALNIDKRIAENTIRYGELTTTGCEQHTDTQCLKFFAPKPESPSPKRTPSFNYTPEPAFNYNISSDGDTFMSFNNIHSGGKTTVSHHHKHSSSNDSIRSDRDTNVSYNHRPAISIGSISSGRDTNMSYNQNPSVSIGSIRSGRDTNMSFNW